MEEITIYMEGAKERRLKLEEDVNTEHKADQEHVQEAQIAPKMYSKMAIGCLLLTVTLSFSAIFNPQGGLTKVSNAGEKIEVGKSIWHHENKKAFEAYVFLTQGLLHLRQKSKMNWVIIFVLIEWINQRLQVDFYRLNHMPITWNFLTELAWTESNRIQLNNKSWTKTETRLDSIADMAMT